MIFKIWSVLHILFILSPFAIFIPLYFLLKNKSQKTKYIVGITLGTLSLFVLILRNVDIFLRNGWDLEVIPLQVCHIGNIVSGLGLILRKKWLLCTTFCFNLIPALCAIIFADSLANYDTLLKIRPQTYIWGHILIIVCALYGLLIYKPKFEKKDLVISLSFVGIIMVTAMVC
ncbi:MAG: YwaF family protein [Clostridia bacterium]|nr:YwaF family protein [Clostridia bacterium]